MPTRKSSKKQRPKKKAQKRAQKNAMASPTTRAKKSALVALVPSVVRPEGEGDPFLRVFKAKWLSQLNFKCDMIIQSLLTLSFMLLARGREQEAEDIADQLIAHVDARALSPAASATMASALYLSAWLKAKRGGDAGVLLERARGVGRFIAYRDREWLSNDVAAELRRAVERRRLDDLVEPFAGILRWLNDSGARAKAEAQLALALDATRSLMRERA